MSAIAQSGPPVLVKYLAVGRLARGPDGQFKADKHQIIAAALAKQNDTAAKNYKAHVKAIMNKGASKLQAGKRIRLTSDDNAYDLHVVSDMLDDDQSKPIVFFAVTDPDFAKSHSIAGLLRDVKDGFYQANSSGDIAAANSSSGSVNRQSQQLFNKLFNQYGSSKLAAVQGKVEEVKDVMKQNVQRALDNVEKLEEIEVKSEEFENQARMFQKDSSKVNRMMRCRYYKITALIVLVVGVILTIIIVPIVKTAQNK